MMFETKCESCGEEPATLHVTLTNLAGDVLDEVDLCRECFQIDTFRSVLSPGPQREEE